MPANDILTLAEFDQFMTRLRTTLAKAEEGAALRQAVAQFFEGAPTRKAAPSAAAAPRTATKGPAPKAAAKGKKGGKVDPEQVYARIAAAPNGIQVIELRKAFGNMPRHQVHTLLQKLRAEKRIVLTGTKRGARWYSADNAPKK